MVAGDDEWGAGDIARAIPPYPIENRKQKPRHKLAETVKKQTKKPPHRLLLITASIFATTCWGVRFVESM